MIDKCTIVTKSGENVAYLEVHNAEEGWYYGKIVEDRFSDEQRQVLQWYAEVAEGQMLSYLDEAVAAVDGLQLQVRLSDTSCEPVYSLHLSKNGDVCFRMTPIPPPQTKRENVGE